MHDFLKSNQIYILIACSIFCVLLAFFVLVIKFHSIRKKRALFKIELGVAALLLSDALSYLFEGNISSTGFWMVRIFNFLLYSFTLADVYFLAEYVTALFMEGGKFAKLPKRLLLGFILPSVGMTFVVINLFTGIYYTIDSANIYSRGPLFLLSVIIPFVSLLLLFSFVLQYKNMINKGLLWSIIVFSICPFLASIAQIFISDISFINLATCQAAIVIFWFALSDQNDELANAANSDLHTRLPNTFGYLYEVDKVINYHDITEYNGYYFDIVRMSNINNKYGKKLGDEIIKMYAAYIKDKIEKDEILGRLGGNFFVALIKKTNTQKFLKLLSDVPVQFEFNGNNELLHIAAVAGVYEINKKNIAAGQILSNTASAVTYAKNVVHRPYVFMDAALEDEFERTRIMEENARKALTNHEFEPYYQPKVDTNGNVLCGAEALVRWKKDGMLVPPFKFVPIMEKNGTVCDLDFYVLECVCEDIKEWISRGITPVPVSVNFSRKNLGNPILAEAIWKVVKKHGIPENLIQIEVTETIDEYPMSYLIGVVEALRRYGLSVAIDDFGTGSSSIKLLKEVQFDVLKIDKSFIDYTDKKGKQLLCNIISMAKGIGIDVIAEGVEDIDRVNDLSEMGCYVIQGYVFGRPVEKKEYEKLLINKSFLI